MARTETLSSVQEALVPGLKRKCAFLQVDDSSLGAAFCIRGHLLSPNDKGVTVEPQLLVSRSHLPLSYLAPQESHDSIPRIFRGNVRPLEAETPETLERHAPSVLIATRKDAIQNAFAIERVSKGIYSLCALASWVRLEDFDGAVRWQKRSKTVPEVGSVGCIHKGPVPTTTGHQVTQKGARDCNRILSQRVQLLMKPPYRTACTKEKSTDMSPLVPQAILAQEPMKQAVQQGDSVKADSAPIANLEEVLENLKRQYQEALYHSKASLAYFAKGPLSRPRRLLLQEEDFPRPSTQELCEALRSCILSRSVIDKKYSVTIPNLVKDLPFGVASEDEVGTFLDPSQIKARKPKKRKKLGKNGLFPGEEEHITRWHARFTREETDDSQGLSREERIKAAVAEQRSRETRMQIILILEIIALELVPSLVTSVDSNTLPHSVGQNTPASKSKRSQNLPEAVDVLVERLCIWQSTDLDVGELTKAMPKGTLQFENPGSLSHKSNNSLGDFCMQVVIPFYGARLPELSASICRRLGVSMGPSPKRPALPRTKSAAKCKDAETLQSKSLKRRKTLERVLTDDKLTRQGPSAFLIRSNTDSAIPRIKREASELSLSDVPAAKGVKAMPRQYSQREVDLTAVSRVAEARLQRKQMIEQEKNAAIALLKKPNARMAVMDLVDAKNQREAGANARSRKSKNPIRNIFAQGVQVTATPQTNRHKDAFQPLPRLVPTRYEPSPEPEAIPPSSDPKVPSSSAKPARGVSRESLGTPIKEQSQMNTSRLALKGTEKSGFLAPPYHDTPVQRRSQLEVPRVPLSVIKENVDLKMGCDETPSRGLNGRTVAPKLLSAEIQRVTSSTPSKGMAGKTVASTPVSSKSATGQAVTSTPSKRQESIYESLGWDNDDVDDLV